MLRNVRNYLPSIISYISPYRDPTCPQTRDLTIQDPLCRGGDIISYGTGTVTIIAVSKPFYFVIARVMMFPKKSVAMSGHTESVSFDSEKIKEIAITHRLMTLLEGSDSK